MSNIGDGHFGTILKACWKNDFVACKKLKNIGSIHYEQIKAFLHELNMHKKMDFCSSIIRILGISYGRFILLFFLNNLFIIDISLNRYKSTGVFTYNAIC
jgi:hypothetical protein